MPKSEVKKEQDTEQCCHSCRYYLEYEDLEDIDIESPNDLTGICRRYPPVIFPSLTALSVYPDVPRNGWCGEYMPQ